MVRVHVFTGRELVYLDDYPTAQHAADDVRSLWNEDDGPQTFLVSDEAGHTLATMVRPAGEGETCLTYWTGGRVERHLCRYHTKDDGSFAWAEVTALAV